MPLAVFRQLRLSPTELTIMQLLMADCTMKKYMGISFDMIVRVDNSICLADFVILDCKVDTQMPIILGRSFMAKVERWLT